MLFLLTRSFHNVVSNNVNAPPNLLSFPFDCIEIRFKTKRDVTAGLGGGGRGAEDGHRIGGREHGSGAVSELKFLYLEALLMFRVTAALFSSSL